MDQVASEFSEQRYCILRTGHLLLEGQRQSSRFCMGLLATLILPVLFQGQTR